MTCVSGVFRCAVFSPRLEPPAPPQSVADEEPMAHREARASSMLGVEWGRIPGPAAWPNPHSLLPALAPAGATVPEWPLQEAPIPQAALASGGRGRACPRFAGLPFPAVSGSESPSAQNGGLSLPNEAAWVAAGTQEAVKSWPRGAMQGLQQGDTPSQAQADFNYTH